MGRAAQRVVSRGICLVSCLNVYRGYHHHGKPIKLTMFVRQRIRLIAKGVRDEIQKNFSLYLGCVYIFFI